MCCRGAVRDRPSRVELSSDRFRQPTTFATSHSIEPAAPQRSASGNRLSLKGPFMIETVVESIRVSLVNQNRVVILKETDGARHLPIWIGVYEAEAIAMEIQGVTAARPLPYDLLKAAILDLGGIIERVAVTELSDEIYYARIFVRQGERAIEIDSRPSDAIAVAVRAHVPILVDERVMDQASLVPDGDDDDEDPTPAAVEAESLGGASSSDEDLSVFRDFINTLDLDDFDKKASG